MEYLIKIDDKVFEETQKILSKEDLTFDLALELFLLKISKRGSVSWMFEKNNKQDESKALNCNPNVKMTKSKALRLIRNEGFNIFDNITFASKNKAGDYFWANPNCKCLQEDWSLILNDYINNKIYLFNVPANEILLKHLEVRADKHNILNLQIAFDDKYFIDKTSGYSFLKFKTCELSY